MTRRKKTDGQRLARLAIDNWPDEIWIAERIDRLIRKRMAEAWENGWFHKTAGTKLDDNPCRGRSKP
jgi:hypothetical protein